MEVEVSPRFTSSFRALHPTVQGKTVARMKMFKESNGRDPRLGVHKLHGKKKEEWAYSVDRSYRITFIFLGDNKVLYTDIGTHDQLY